MYRLRLPMSTNYPCCESKPFLLAQLRDDKNRSSSDNDAKGKEEGGKCSLNDTMDYARLCFKNSEEGFQNKTT